VIHLKDSACAATQDPDNENIWKINTGFDNCGSEFGYASDVDKLTLSNTLSIGNSVVGGRVVSRRYDIAFICMFNNVAEATSSISASNTIYSELTFNINQEQPAELGFPFNLNFYESEAFTTIADLTTGAFQPGAALFGSVTPASALPSSLMFSVGKCTVEDTTITQSLDVLDTCPVDGLSFEFKNTQSDASAVNFAFEGFVFPTSADDTTIDVTCSINVCPVGSIECLNLCQPILAITLLGEEPYAPSADNLLTTIEESAAYHTFQVDIFCVHNHHPDDSTHLSILQVGTGESNWETIGSRVFSFWRDWLDNKIFIANPVLDGTHVTHACVDQTWNTYKFVVEQNQDDSSKSDVSIFVNDELQLSETRDASALIGDGVPLQVWVGKNWDMYRSATEHLIRNLIYTPAY